MVFTAYSYKSQEVQSIQLGSNCWIEFFPEENKVMLMVYKSGGAKIDIIGDVIEWGEEGDELWVLKDGERIDDRVWGGEGGGDPEDAIGASRCSE